MPTVEYYVMSRRTKRLLWRILFCWAIVCGTAACRDPAASPIVVKYKSALCIPFSTNPTVSPHTREWSAVLTLRDGSKVTVSGAQIPGGRINVNYLTTGHQSVAADAGDYVYPADVRVDPKNDLLFIKASGLAGGMRQETWLFEYDLHRQRLVARRRVVNDQLPAECPETSAR